MPGDTMNHSHSPYLFHQTLEQVRKIGARGGRASGRNRRARKQARSVLSPPPAHPDSLHTETAAEAIATLDVQFPWLRGAEKRLGSHKGRRAGPPPVSHSR